ncbi:MAG: MBL fold metallo-hydrolase [Elusimicrobiota bacterium]
MQIAVALKRMLPGLALLLGLLVSPWTALPVSADTIEDLKGRSALSVSFGDLPQIAPLPAGAAVKPAGVKRDMKVYFIDVGQGDAQYIELPNGQNALIDGGPSNKKISAFLKQHGVDKIDHVVLTHPHADHYKGLNYVFDELQVNNFYDTRMDNSGAKGDDVVREKAANEPGCSTSYPGIGQRLPWGDGVYAKVLNSCADKGSSIGGADGGREINNCSIVIKLEYDGRSVLFTGDAQSKVERQMIERYGDKLTSNILKVGHHGSSESTIESFLNAVTPHIAVISVGNNGYGVPTSETLTRLQKVGAKIHRTDKSGTLVTPWVSSYSGEALSVRRYGEDDIDSTAPTYTFQLADGAN